MSLRSLTILIALGFLVLAALRGEEQGAGMPSETGAPERITVVGEQLQPAAAREALRIRVTGNTEALLQWCACTTGQGFMVSKRAFLLREGSPGDILRVDAGRAFSGDSETDKERAMSYLAIMESLGYVAGVLGPDVLALGSDFVASRIESSGVRWLLANVEPPRPDAGTLKHSHDGRVIQWIGLVSPSLCEARLLEPFGWKLVDPLETYRAVAAGSSGETLTIVLGPLDEEDVRRLTEEPTAPDLVISSGPRPPQDVLGYIGRQYLNPEKTQHVEWPSARRVVNRTNVIHTQVVGPGGFIELDIPSGLGFGMGYSHILSTMSTPDDADVKRMTDRFFQLVRGRARDDAARYARSTWSEEVRAGRTFVGAHACRSCHEDEWGQWRSTDHASAYGPLVGHDRWFYPLCVACHVTGLGRNGGFEIGDQPLTLKTLFPAGSPRGASLPEPPLGLEGVQCEACHGPGSAHVAHPEQAGTIAAEVPQSICLECHDARNSPAFLKDVEGYISRVRH